MRKILAAVVGLGAGALLLAATGFAQMDEPVQEPQAQQAPQDQKDQKDSQISYQITGQVAESDAADKMLKIKDEQNNFVVPLKIDEETRITMNGKEVTLAQVPTCAEARASYKMEGDQFVAESITLRSPTGVGGAGEQEMEKEDRPTEPDTEPETEPSTPEPYEPTR